MDETKQSQYSNEALQSVIEEMSNSVLCKSVENKYGFPRVTLMRKFKNHSETKERTRPSTKFTVEQETILVNWIKYMVKTGFSVSKKTLIFNNDKLAQEYNVVEKVVRWLLKSHRDFNKRTTHNLSVQRRCAATNRCMVRRGWSLYKGEKMEKTFKNQNGVLTLTNQSFFNPKPAIVFAVKSKKYTLLQDEMKKKI